jgi:hypothetical protein
MPKAGDAGPRTIVRRGASGRLDHLRALKEWIVYGFLRRIRKPEGGSFDQHAKQRPRYHPLFLGAG